MRISRTSRVLLVSGVALGLAWGAGATVAAAGPPSAGQGSLVTSTTPDPANVVTFRDPVGDVVRGHDIRKVRVRNGLAAVRVTVWHRDLRAARQYSFRMYLDTDPSTSTPEVKVYGAFPNADFVACTTGSWSTSARNGCDPERAVVQCRVNMDVRWARDVTTFEFLRTRRCLTDALPVRVNVSIKQYWPVDTRWDFAPGRRLWSRTVPTAG